MAASRTEDADLSSSEVRSQLQVYSHALRSLDALRDYANSAIVELGAEAAGNAGGGGGGGSGGSGGEGRSPSYVMCPSALGVIDAGEGKKGAEPTAAAAKALVSAGSGAGRGKSTAATTTSASGAKEQQLVLLVPSTQVRVKGKSPRAAAGSSGGGNETSAEWVEVTSSVNSVKQLNGATVIKQ